MKLSTVKELTTRAVSLSVRQDVIYCNITLRPVQAGNKGSSSGYSMNSSKGNSSGGSGYGGELSDVQWTHYRSIPYLQVGLQSARLPTIIRLLRRVVSSQLSAIGPQHSLLLVVTPGDGWHRCCYSFFDAESL
jgi:hypothetical protein